MEFFRKSKKIILGGLTGGFITMFGPVTPIGIPEKYYTLEELSYQATVPKQHETTTQWTFQWIYPKGFTLREKTVSNNSGPIYLRQAVYRSVIDVFPQNDSLKKEE